MHYNNCYTHLRFLFLYKRYEGSDLSLSDSQSSGQKWTEYIVEVTTAPIVNQSNSSQIEVRNYDGAGSIIKQTAFTSPFIFMRSCIMHNVFLHNVIECSPHLDRVSVCRLW